MKNLVVFLLVFVGAQADFLVYSKNEAIKDLDLITNNTIPNFNTEDRSSKILVDEKFDRLNKKIYPGRQFLESYNSLNPVMVLVDNTAQSRKNAANFIKTTQEIHPKVKNINFQLMLFNSTGVTTVLANTFKNDTEFLAILKQYRDNQSCGYLGAPKSEGSVAFFAALNAAKLLDYGGGILIFTDREVIDEDIAIHASKFILKKRIKVFVVWGGRIPTVNEEYKFLRELCDFTSGRFIVNVNSNLNDFYRRQFYENGAVSESLSLVLTKNNLNGNTTLNFPIDSNVKGIHITVRPGVKAGILITPKGTKINVTRPEDVSSFAVGSFLDENPSNYDIHINTTTLSPNEFGPWKFQANNGENSFQISVYVYSKLVADPLVVQQVNLTDKKKEIVDVLNLNLEHGIFNVKDVNFYDAKGNLLTGIKDNSNQMVWQRLTDNSTAPPVLKLPVRKLPNKSFYALVSGHDMKGYNFSRLSYVNPYGSKGIFPKPPLTIEVSENSDLILDSYSSNQYPKIYFEVTNHGSKPVDLRFSARDERYLLLYMAPLRTILNPEATTTVALTLTLARGSYVDQITFAAYASEVIEKRVILDVGTNSQGRNDHTNPILDYSYTSDCTNILIGDCKDGTWTIEVTARDDESGLLKVTSYPKGLYFPNGFTTGTKEYVTGSYSDSCCYPDIQLMAIDRANNRIVKNANAYRTIWSAGAIIALCFGILFLIIIILIIIYVIRKYCCSEKDEFELSTYRGRTRYTDY